MEVRWESTLLLNKPPWFLNENHIVLTLTSLYLRKKSSEVCLKPKTTRALPPLKGPVTLNTSVKCAIGMLSNGTRLVFYTNKQTLTSREKNIAITGISATK